MSIITSSDYHLAINFLTTENVANIGDVKEKMNSVEINDINNEIELQLCSLYEKTRVLEDVINYCREYMIKEISEKRQKFEEKLKTIEHNADSFQDTSFVACEVPFKSSGSIIKDRDGSTISSSNIISNRVIMSGSELGKSIFSSISKKNNSIFYRDSLQELLLGNPYRVFYLLDNSVANGVEEEITINFDGIYECNFLDIVVSNCEIIEIKYINEIDVEETIEDINNNCSSIKKMKSIKIKIRSNNYKNEKCKIDKGEIQLDFWDIIQKDQFTNTTDMVSVYDISNAVGIIRHEQSQEDFKYLIDVWQKEKETTLSKNIMVAQKFGGDTV